MSIAGLVALLFALIAALLLVLYTTQRRDLRKVAELSQQLQRAASADRRPDRVQVTSERPEVAALIITITAGEA